MTGPMLEDFTWWWYEEHDVEPIAVNAQQYVEDSAGQTTDSGDVTAGLERPRKS